MLPSKSHERPHDDLGRDAAVSSEAGLFPETDADLGDLRKGDKLDQVRARVDALIAIAAVHGAPMRIEDVMQLLPFRAFQSLSEFEKFLHEDEMLKTHVNLDDGFLVEHGRLDLLASHTELSRLTSRRIALAHNFVDRLVLKCPWVLVAGISGSTVYGNAKPEDDLDFFLIVTRRRMWITLLVAFLLGRIDRKLGHSPTYCFNRTLEDYESIRDFGALKEPLVAREALTMLVLRGESYYVSLLSTSKWMERYFPVLYEARRKTQEHVKGNESISRGGPQWNLVNGLAFMIVATYLVVTGFARNARLARQGRVGAQFRTVVRLGFCAYESNKYDGLRNEYREVIR